MVVRRSSVAVGRTPLTLGSPQPARKQALRSKSGWKDSLARPTPSRRLVSAGRAATRTPEPPSPAVSGVSPVSLRRGVLVLESARGAALRVRRTPATSPLPAGASIAPPETYPAPAHRHRACHRSLPATGTSCPPPSGSSDRQQASIRDGNIPHRGRAYFWR